ncbi:hypothetical protein KKF91_12245 [Myxococcota bacterium]|nr:hypothetical protein [Myxococcota bacterium]MBU1431302.1 hypothetical protein [Myxococcota bacterium]MBU1896949.1 hypothetical protein [Myxococcota bacterium]
MLWLMGILFFSGPDAGVSPTPRPQDEAEMIQALELLEQLEMVEDLEMLMDEP